MQTVDSYRLEFHPAPKSTSPSLPLPAAPLALQVLRAVRQHTQCARLQVLAKGDLRHSCLVLLL